ncbi:MAG: LssY C-terminal domain-containing protein [Acidobacteriaceae bacterium]
MKSSVYFVVSFVFVTFGLYLPACAQECPVSARTITVPGTQQWTDTKLDVVSGDQLTFAASGTLQFQGSQATNAAGLARGWRDLLRAMPVNAAGNGALVGRIGAPEVAEPFLIGRGSTLTARSSGRLYLGINQLADESSPGAYSVGVCLVRAPKKQAAAAITPAIQIGNDVLDKIPRRISDATGAPGDMVNFLVVGDQDKLLAAFKDAGWVQVDKTKALAVLDATLQTLQKQSYVEMPMSELYLFGRPQDFGMAHAEPIQVIASRNHLRLWKAPEQVDGKTLWVGAATHDIGFERDQRGSGKNITHKIDPKVDAERDFVRDSLTSGGGIAATSYVLPNNPVQQAKTATGGTFQSDGRILVVTLP